MKGYGYIRVSTKRQAESGVGLDAQRQMVEAYARFAGIELVDVLVDPATSGYTSLRDRDAGRLLFEPEMAGLHVVAYSLDRLFRNTRDGLASMDEWDELDVTMHLSAQGGQAINTSSAEGRLMITFFLGIAQYERDVIQRRTANAMRNLKETGRNTGTAPYGYFVAEDGKTLVEDASEMRTVRRARELRGDGLSLRAIGLELVDAGMLPRSGGAWHPQQVKSLLVEDA